MMTQRRRFFCLVALTPALLVGFCATAPAQASPADAPAGDAATVVDAPAPTEPAPEVNADAPAREPRGEELYDELQAKARNGDPMFAALSAAAQSVDWTGAATQTFMGNLRRFEVGGDRGGDFFLLRARTGEVYLLEVPADSGAIAKDSGTPYAGLLEMVKHKMSFTAALVPDVIDGTRYTFARLTVAPQRSALDRLFFVAIVILLFLTMVGMGLTLTLGDFAVVFKKPLGVILGIAAQFGLMPLLALAVGHLSGFYDSYPFIFLGLILISATPGGVTSNLMTYLGKGDVALSVALTAICTVLALVATPLLLTLYAADLPAFTIPVTEVFKTMLVLVIAPLAVGMLVRAKAAAFAKRAEKPFAGLGILALLFLIIVGVWSNLDSFADTDRYGFKFYAVVFLLTLSGMVFGGLLAKLARIKNFQVRAIALEVGLRNASLAMTIAILLQDRIGDFASSMFFTSGIFGLWMYFAGALSIVAFKKLLPVGPTEPAAAPERAAA